MSRRPYPLPTSTSTGNLPAISHIKAWTRDALALEPEVALSVSQLACAEEGCPPVETVILVLLPGERGRKYSIHKSIAEISEADVRACVSEPYVML